MLILVDGSSYLYRAFHGLPPLTTAAGQPTGAIYGVMKMLKKLCLEYPDAHIAVIFDSKGKTFRNDLYPAYKAHRPSMPDALRAQIAPLHALIKAMGLPLLMIDGVEADDVIGTLATHALAENQTVLISTSDKDMAQLIHQHITLINTMSNTSLDETTIVAKFGVNANQIIDYLTLVGDTSDNIPGVPGVGPKTAAKWLNQYDTLDNLIAHCDALPGKIGEAFKHCIPQFPLIKSLVTIKCDVALPITLSDLQRKPENTEKLNALLQQLEFYQPEKPPVNIKASKNYQCILDRAALDQLIKKLNQAEIFAIDTETTSLNIIDARIVGLSFGFENSEAYYIPLGHDYPGAPQQLSLAETLLQLKPILEDKNKLKIGHHIKYDMNIFKNHDIDLASVQFDTMLESYVLDSIASRHNMDSLALKYLGHKTIHFEDVAGKGTKQLTFNQVGITEACEYAAEDADVTFQLHQTLYPKLQQNPGALAVFENIEMPLSMVLGDMERTGVFIDAALLHQQSEKLAKRLETLENAAYAEAGQPFNLSSPKQLQAILYDQLKLPILEKTPSGQPSTAENVLQELASNYTLPKIILEHRSLSKLKTTYTDKLPEQINAATQRIHTSYQQAVTSTGRLSSSQPNLQNIPIKTEEGRQIRKAFIAPPGCKILSADYSQIELRLMAHISQDANLLKAFANNLDIHSATASEIFNMPLTAITHEQRRYAKTINFGLIYGMSAFGLAKQLGLSRDTAQAYIDTYFTRYPGVKQYMEAAKKNAHEKGYVTTLLGRPLYLPDINSKNGLRQKAAERAAINAPLQGSAADLIKLAMIHIHQWLIGDKISARMIMQVHDELVFEVDAHQADFIQTKIKTFMETAMPLSVPLIVSIGIGHNWDEAH